ncbi:hypothetical protein CBL_00875 [Carabus blaptoides fortunei]
MAITKFFVVFVLTTLFVDSFAATVVRKQRSEDSVKTGDKENDQVTDICQKSAPCGWAVYKPFVRTIEYFIKNRCLCPENKKCVRTDDDLSISAYVYRCRDGVTNREK